MINDPTAMDRSTAGMDAHQAPDDERLQKVTLVLLHGDDSREHDQGDDRPLCHESDEHPERQ